MSIRIHSKRATIALLPDENAIVLSSVPGGVEYKQTPPSEGYKIEDISCKEEQLSYGIRCAGAPYPIRCLWSFTSEGYPLMTLSADHEMPFEGYFKYPSAFDAVPDDVLLIPIQEGFAFPVDDPDVVIPSLRMLYNGWMNSMDFWGITKGDAWMLAALDSGCDAVMFSERGKDGFYRVQLGWESEKGMWGYDRKITFLMGDTGGITAACKTYRTYRKEMGYVVTFKEKLKKTPNLKLMPGAVNFWLFEDRSFDDPQPHPVKKVSKPRDPVRIADEMKSMGIDRVLWSHAESREVVSYLRDELGYIPGRYDMYRDVMSPTFKLHLPPKRYHESGYSHNDAWPDEIIVDKNGEFQNCWALTCLDGVMRHQHALCDIHALKWAMTDIPADMREKGYLSRFVDTTFSVALEECYQPEHPMTRSTCLKYRKLLMGYIKDWGLITGSEDGLEACVPEVDYSEGMMSPGFYRAEDAGRRMTTVYTGEQVEENVKRFMMDGKYRAPLWELVYHDCMTAYWYWGDPSNCCPEYWEKRDLLNALYGTPPLYCLTVSQWETYKDDVKASYERGSVVARHAGHNEMLSFEYMTPDKCVQKTEFAGGITVIANFGDAPYTLSDGTVVPSVGKLVFGITTD